MKSHIIRTTPLRTRAQKHAELAEICARAERHVDEETVLGHPIVASVNLKSAYRQGLPNQDMAELFVREYIDDSRHRPDALKIAALYRIEVTTEEPVVIAERNIGSIAELNANQCSGSPQSRTRGQFREYHDEGEKGNWVLENMQG